MGRIGEKKKRKGQRQAQAGARGQANKSRPVEGRQAALYVSPKIQYAGNRDTKEMEMGVRE